MVFAAAAHDVLATDVDFGDFTVGVGASLVVVPELTTFFDLVAVVAVSITKIQKDEEVTTTQTRG